VVALTMKACTKKKIFSKTCLTSVRKIMYIRRKYYVKLQFVATDLFISLAVNLYNHSHLYQTAISSSCYAMGK
jgi:hypothetical protein